MAYRAQSFFELCSVCRDRTQTLCLRCATPLCGDHDPAPDRRCESCESSFATAHLAEVATEWKPSLRREAFVLFASVLLKFGMVAILVGLLLVSVGSLDQVRELATLTGAWLVVFLGIRRVAEGPNQRARLRRARRRFMAEHIRPGTAAPR